MVEDNHVNLPFHRRVRNKVAQLSRLRISFNDNDAAVRLKCHHHEAGVLVEGEVTREQATGGDLLQRGEATRGRIDGEVDYDVRDDGSSILWVVKVWNLEGGFVAGGDDEEVLVRLDVPWVSFLLFSFLLPFFYPFISPSISHPSLYSQNGTTEQQGERQA